MLDPAIKKLASIGKNFGTVCVCLPNGQIASHVMWVDADDDHIIFNTEVHRAKFKAIQANPHVTLSVWDADDAYSYAEVRGHVAETIRGDEARAHIDALFAPLPRCRLPQSDPERASDRQGRSRPPADEQPVNDPTNGPVGTTPLVGVVMGSASDWPTMTKAVEVLEHFRVGYEARVVSAHRMPDEMFAYAEQAAGRGLRAIIAGAGGAAHLPGMLSAKTLVPVLGVPVASRHLSGQDSLFSIVQMPAGIPTATFAIGEAGATNAALFAVAILAAHDADLAARLQRYRDDRRDQAASSVLPPQ